MRTHHGYQMALCGGASIVLALGACAAQAQESTHSDSRVIVTQPGQSLGMTRVVKQNGPPDAENQEIRIERRVVDGKEQVQLWINGKQVDVQSMDDVQKVLGEHGEDIDIQAFGDAQDGEGHGSGVDEFRLTGPTEFEWPQLDADSMFVLTQPKSMLGVQLVPISDDLRDYIGLEGDAGVRVSHVVDDSPAAKAGLEDNDIIIAAEIGSESHESIGVSDLRQAIAQTEPDTKVTLTVLRRGEKMQITATLAKWDGDKLGAMIMPEGGLIFTEPQGGQLELQALPDIRQRLIEIKPQLREMQIERHKSLKDAMPDRNELLKSMERQMEQMQKMLDQLREQQNQLHRQIEKSATPEA